MNQIAKELEKCKYKSFGKVKKKGKNEERSTVRNLLNRKIELFSENKENKKEDEIKDIEKEIIDNLRKEEASKLEKEKMDLYKLKASKGTAAAIFKIKEKITGNKKSSLVPTVVKNPETGKEEHAPNKIKDVCV